MRYKKRFKTGTIVLSTATNSSYKVLYATYDPTGFSYYKMLSLKNLKEVTLNFDYTHNMFRVISRYES